MGVRDMAGTAFRNKIKSCRRRCCHFGDAWRRARRGGGHGEHAWGYIEEAENGNPSLDVQDPRLSSKVKVGSAK
eukprot:8411987-Alexandrium_andersonii.AAC.1